MNKKLLRILLLLLFIGGVGFHLKSQGQVLGDRVEAVGNLLFKYLGVKIDGAPLFVIEDFKPGDCVTRIVDVENNATTDSDVAVRSVNEIDLDSLSTVFTITIKEGVTVLYNKHLDEFFADSDAVDGVPLSTVPGESSTSYEFTVCFDIDAGNEFQEKSVQFDLKFGEITPPPIPLPAVCKDLEGIVTEKIEGTPGDDNIKGTTASELILGKAGNDKIKGGGGHDCIIGGGGNDYIKGGSGNDIITGNAGNDKIKGGSGYDVIRGGLGDDNIDGGSGNDTIYGHSGEDKIKGGNGDDLIYGGKGNDKIKGGSGHDDLRGQAGNDNIKGGSGNDTLHGGPGFDKLNGNMGVDICIGESKISCEH